MAKLAVEISKDAKSDLGRELTRTQAQVAELEAKLKQAGRTGRRAGGDLQKGFGGDALNTLARYAMGVASIGTAIGTLKKQYDVWLRDMRASADEAHRATRAYVSLAALQEGGQKAQAVMRATALGARYGITDRDVAYDIVQAMQSRYQGDLTAGLAAAETIFAATQVGIPLELGKELEVLGGAQKQETGRALRRAYVAGQLSERDPRTLARAAPALKFWQDKDVGFAAAAAIAASVQPEKVETQVRSGAIALGPMASAGFQKTLQRLGLADATQLEKLKGLRAAGIVTPEQIGRAGLAEIRQVEALSTLLLNIDRIEDWTTKIRDRAEKPGLFARERAKIEADIPMTRLARRIDETRAEYLNEMAFGPQAEESMRMELRDRMRGLTLRRLGLQARWYGALDEEGRASPWDWFMARMMEQTAGRVIQSPDADAIGSAAYRTRMPVAEADARIDQHVEQLMRLPAQALLDAANALRETSKQLKGGPTMVPATTDN